MSQICPNVVKNEDLRSEQIPGPDAPLMEVLRFSHLFDGYEYWGDYFACAAVARAKRHDTLTDLRTCLFFEVRLWRTASCSPGGQTWPPAEAQNYMRTLVELIREKVETGQLE